MPTISVVIPSFNRLSMLQHAIDSVLAQTLPADEIIVVDDGSTDDTTTILQPQYRQVKFLRQQHLGVSSARNTGIKAAHGDWVALLDSDDIWHTNKLQTQMQAIAQTHNYLICHSDEVWIRHGVQVNPMQKHAKTGHWIFQSCLPRCVISPSTVLIKSTLFDELGYFDESLLACEDYDLWLRFCCRYPVLYIATKLITKYDGHNDQLSRCYWGMDRFRIKALHNIISTGTLNTQDLQAAINTMIEKIEIYLNGAKKRGNTKYVTEFEYLLAKYT